MLETGEAKQLGKRLGINWAATQFTPKDLSEGMVTELEHGKSDPETNVTNDSPVATGKITWKHLKEDKDYYPKLHEMEKGATSLKQCYLLGASACLARKR